MSQFNAPAYDVEKPTGVCALSGEPLEPGSPFMATLVEVEPGEVKEEGKQGQNAAAALGLKRVDVSMKAWDAGKRPERVFSYWKSTVPEPNQKRRMFVDDAVLLNLLRRLADTDNADRLAFRFVLALILLRKKMLRYDRTETRNVGELEHQWWVTTPKLDPAKGPLGKWNEEETIEILDPKLDESRITQVTEQLGQILEAEL
ncbi:MAG: hypothetical protein GC164_04385 [Phycisphaera sp.]|nr:hypothetical protein [Phycisphaera sp.]